ncbi:hypothetical protein EJ05DRAFT_540420 [Pseudovirgaria hyperparasitica]|uniref:DUF676 domain-containing protein n=1 Tax=Pseudovirgaria hyperparasitica TaxID=470096 RepID=A0A6A6W1B1_9PEZI|nr:uncharacterized protein EJ05DRAFT_540420 [Pseudovirgaria hyperparasitica]KAF2755764.1 hypothetical protein EJ05DRAFT_540420 [Pseudovirgaria hyperparasitica]
MCSEMHESIALRGVTHGLEQDSGEVSVQSTYLSCADHSTSSIASIRGTRSLTPWEEQKDPLGLNVVWEPEKPRSLDIILVHGLGGTSRSTWSKDRDPENFWPGKWLPQEPEICTARVLSFGYDADWRSTAGKTIFSITDFAKELLFSMKFAKHGDKALEDLGIGQAPIIFIVHSMGGIVVKQAYILGQHDPDYIDLVKAISAIVFLSTPHRGSNLAELLNRILSASFLKFTPKRYIAEINKNSLSLEQINEQFRRIAPTIQIVSFYETLETVIGPKRVMVVEKGSAVLGYPGEISRSLNADHHNICKYTSKTDPNYISTCGWILEHRTFVDWVHPPTTSKVLWTHALPASGKSILSTFIISHLRQLGLSCHFFFFRFADQAKQSPNACLRSLALQIARDIPQIRSTLKAMALHGQRLEKADARTIWQKVFTSTMCKVPSDPIYWVIDALDECDSPQVLLLLFASLSSWRIPVRILVVSRHAQPLASAFDRLNESLPVRQISVTGKEYDIRLFVEYRLRYQRWDQDFRHQITEKILQRAASNFLWVTLAVEEVLKRHTFEDIDRAIEEMPNGMQEMYRRMDASIAKDSGTNDEKLARTLLTWAICSRRIMNLRELSDALRNEFPTVPDLRHTVPEICGQFVVVDTNHNVVMIHETARDFLTNTSDISFYIDTRVGHEVLFTRCLNYLMDTRLRSKINQSSIPLSQGFLLYAATSWSFHLSCTSSISSEAISLLKRFFRSRHVLSWIQVLASVDQLGVLVYSSQALSHTVSHKRKNETKSALEDLQDIELLDAWSVDLRKVMGKFGLNLLQEPSGINRLIPQFCPRNSMLFRQFAEDNLATPFNIAGLSYDDWDDSLAKINFSRGSQASKVVSTGRHFAVLTSGTTELGTIQIADSLNYTELSKLQHGEFISHIAFNVTGELLVSCGYHTTKLWHVPSGHVHTSVPSPKDTRVMDVVFIDGNTILTASDDKWIRRLVTTDVDPQWFKVQTVKDDFQIQGAFANAPCFMAFNQSASQIAVAYRGFPLSVYGTEDHELVGRCRRHYSSPTGSNSGWSGVDRLSWNSLTGYILGLYNDGCVFKWNPFEDQSHELRRSATEITCSPDGMYFATCDNSGTIGLFNFDNFTLLYSLSSETPCIGLAISSDCRRIYDLRESSCTVWQPDALTKFYETEHHNEGPMSDVGSSTIFAPTCMKQSDYSEPITAVAVAPNGNFFCTGNEAGVVTFYDRKGDVICEVFKSPRCMMIDRLAWDDDNSKLAIAELSGNVAINTFDPSAIMGRNETALSRRTQRSSLSLIWAELNNYCST